MKKNNNQWPKYRIIAGHPQRYDSPTAGAYCMVDNKTFPKITFDSGGGPEITEQTAKELQAKIIHINS